MAISVDPDQTAHEEQSDLGPVHTVCSRVFFLKQKKNLAVTERKPYTLFVVVLGQVH